MPIRITDSHPTTDVSAFTGLDNVNATHEVGLTRLTEASNVDVTRTGKVRRRGGQTQVVGTVYNKVVCPDGSTVLGLASDGNVHQLDDSFTSQASYNACVGYPPYNKLSALRILDQIIFSNGYAVGLCDALTRQEQVFDTSDFGDRTFDYSTPVPFVDAELFSGRAYYAHLDRVYYSPVFGYFKLRLGKDYFRLPDYVTMVAQARTGIFVSTIDSVFYIDSRDPGVGKVRKVSDAGAIEGSKTYVEGSLVGSGETTDMLPVWSTASGFCVGFPGGSVNHITQKYVTLPQGSLGSTIFRKQNGQSHIVSVIQT